MRVRDICTHWMDAINSNSSLSDAARHMRDRNVGFLPVLDEDNVLAGVVTDRDIVVRGLAEAKNPIGTSVGEIMSTDVFTCSEDDSVDEAARLMEHQQIRRLVVIDVDGKAVGILSLGDVATKAHTEVLVGEAVEQISQPCEPRR
ncbi:MAG: CBS domain-containing protein [Phycisphaerae bacterium]|nr:CBS domain-containing protein [Phycisphaerae bacterium]